MERSKFGASQGESLDSSYQNGQSDAEKLMHKHLQSDEPITDQELKELKITKATATESTPASERDRAKDDDSEEESGGTDRIITPLDMLGS